MIEVFIAKGPEQSRSFVINGETAQIGRGAANQICLDEPSVSRKHARIYGHNGQYFIEDLQSRNGTWINGNVIQSGVRLQVKEGVPIAVGNGQPAAQIGGGIGPSASSRVCQRGPGGVRV